MTHLGRYLGRAEDAPGRGRSDAERVTELAGGGDDASAGLETTTVAETLFRVIVLESGVSARFAPGEDELTSRIADRDAVAAMLTALERRDSLTALFEPLSPSLLSLFMTSANAFPTEAKPKD